MKGNEGKQARYEVFTPAIWHLPRYPSLPSPTIRSGMQGEGRGF